MNKVYVTLGFNTWLVHVLLEEHEANVIEKSIGKIQQWVRPTRVSFCYIQCSNEAF